MKPSQFLAAACLFTALFAGFSVPARAALEPPVLRVSLESEPVTLDWNNAKTAVDRLIISFLMRGLLQYDAQGKLACDLCKTYRVSADGKTFTFELNPEEKWSDGKPLEAQHFVDSIKRLQNPQNHFKNAEDYQQISQVLAEGKSTLIIHLSKSSPGFAHLFTRVPVYPLRKDVPLADHPQVAVLGPYFLAEWKRGKHLVIEGNPDYHGTRPVFRVVFNFGKHSEQVAAFQKGKLDILTNPTNDDVMRMPGQKVQVSPYWATRMLLLNAQKPLTRDLGVRRAILYSLDRESLPAFLKDGERKVTGLVPPGLQGYRDLPLATADLARAQSERSKAIPWPKEEQLSLLTLDTGTDRRLSQWLTERLEKIHFKLKVEAKPLQAYFAALEAGRFDLALSTWAFQTANPQEILRSFRTDAANNRGKWTNVAYDALLDQLVQEADFGKIPRDLDQVTQLLEVQEVGVIPLGYPTQPFLLGPRVVSFAITPFGDPDLVKIELKH